MISAQTRRLSREKPLHTHRVVARGHAFPDHAQEISCRCASFLEAKRVQSGFQSMSDNPARADGARVLADLNALRNIGAYKTGVHKPTFSEPHMRSLEWLAQRLPDAKLSATIDGIGNV